MPRSRPRLSAATAALLAASSMCHVPCPITGTVLVLGPKGCCLILPFLRRRVRRPSSHPLSHHSRSSSRTRSSLGNLPAGQLFFKEHAEMFPAEIGGSNGQRRILRTPSPASQRI